jgi:hypothetical protein
MTLKEFAALGGKARAKALGKDGMSKAGRKAAQARWSKVKPSVQASTVPTASV